MRLFRSYKDRFSGKTEQGDVNSEEGRSENSPQKSILRGMSILFSRSPNLQSSSDVVSPQVDGYDTRGRIRKGWRSFGLSKGNNINCSKQELASSKSFGLKAGPSNAPDISSNVDYPVRRSNSSASLDLSLLSIRDQEEPDYHASSDFDLQSCNSLHYPRSPSAKASLSPSLDNLRDIRACNNFTGYEDRLRTSPTAESSSSSERRVFEIKHANSLNIESTTPFDCGLWFESECNAKDQRNTTKERDFFNIRKRISSFRRNLSVPKGFPSSNKSDSQTSVSNVRPSSTRNSPVSAREAECSVQALDLDGQKSPGRSNISFLMDFVVNNQDKSWQQHKSESNGFDISCDYTAKADDCIALSKRKERVVRLSSKEPPDITSVAYAKIEVMESQKIEETFSSLPLLKDTTPANRSELFQKKLIACQTIVDFDVRKQMQRAIELKRQTLLEIIEYISTTRNCMNERVLQDVIDMVAANVFRSLPPSAKKTNIYYDSEDDEPTLEKSWPHLQIVYDVFLRVIVSNEVTSKMAKNVIDKPFVLKLLTILNSEDQRERDYLKTILHRIYGKIMPFRNFMRKAIDNVFTNFIYETESHYGITELLEILGSIINGFAIPLKEEHKVYLEKTLSPLHKAKSIRTYHPALTYCMIQYINKDRALVTVVLKAILNYWPKTNTQKEILFLNELEEVLTLAELPELNVVINPLARRLSLCMGSTHFQVAERALYIWNNERIVRLLNLNKEIVYPHVVPVIQNSTKNHWNDAVRGLTYNLAKLMYDHDQELYDQCISQSECHYGCSKHSTGDLECREKIGPTKGALQEL